MDPNRIPASPHERQLFHWVLLCALVLIAALAWPFWRGQIYTADDLGAFHLPTRAIYAERLAAGEAFDWSPDLYGGYYLSGEGQIGGYHPLHQLLYRCFDLRAAFCLEVLLSYPVLLTGTYYFLRRRIDRTDAALFGALAFTFSGFALLHFMHTNGIAVLAQLPWQLVAIDVLFAAGRRRQLMDRQFCVDGSGATASSPSRVFSILCTAGQASSGTRRLRFDGTLAAFVAIALLTGSQLLLGYPQFVWFSLLTELAFIIYLDRRDHIVPRGVLIYSGAKVIGLLLGAVQLLPTLDVMQNSVRASITHAALVEGSLHPWNLAQLIGPYLFQKRVVGQNTHELGIYVGAVPLLLVAWLLVNFRHLRQGRHFAKWMVGFAAVTLLLALGQWGGLFSVQEMLPLVGKFRFPSRYIALFSLATASLAAIAFADLARRCDEPPFAERMPSYCPLWITLASALIAVAAPFLWGVEHLGGLGQVIAGPLLFLIAAALLIAADRGIRPALVGLVILTAFDLGVYGLTYSVYAGRRTDAAIAESDTLPPGSPHDRVLADLTGPRSTPARTGNQMLLSGWQRFDGYAGLEPARRLRYTSLPVLQLAGVRWVAATPAAKTIVGLNRVNDHWLEAPHPLPRLRLVTTARVAHDPRDIETAAIYSVAIVEHAMPLSGGPIGQLTVQSHEPGRIEAKVSATTPQLLVNAESFHAGWQATIDGRAAPVERVNGDFMGCLIPAGEHEVVLRFQPTSLLWGRRLSGVGIAVLAIVAMFGMGRDETTRIAEVVSAAV